MEAYQEINEVEPRMWDCPLCFEEHSTKARAEKCCASWNCGWCGEEFETKKAANECCKGEE